MSEPLTPLTKQEYFDLLVKTSREGGFPSVVPTSGETQVGYDCAYRTADGRKCGIGLLIPDTKYVRPMEGARPTADFWAAYPDAIRPVEGFRHAGSLHATNDYIAVQMAHDALAVDYHGNLKAWDHAEFVRRLLELPCFAGVEYAGEPA